MRIFFCIIFFFLNLSVFSQEIVSPLNYNSTIQSKDIVNIIAKNNSINLPFIDDFSYDSHYPDQLLWEDNSVFINRTLALEPVTIGVATFDGLDSLGFPYNVSAINLDGDSADILTSGVINLSTIDTAFFMFYYQPQGVGDAPQNEDSLILQFLDDSSQWKTVWKKHGQALHPFKKKVLVFPTIEYNVSFQFRFLNYATVSGNYDHWHIDYVKLDKYNNSNDTTSLSDVSFVYNSPSFLKRYSEMPWTHFKDDIANELSDSVNIYLRNNNASISVDYQYNVYQNSVLVDEYPSIGSSRNVSVIDYDSIGLYSFSNPPILVSSSVFPTTFSSLDDSASFLIEHIIGTSPSDNKMNDTIYHYQKFFSHFSYDDGSAESAYGINVSGAMGALQFKLNRPDTLRAVQIYFPQMLDSVSNIPFFLTVWDDISGNPGDVLYSSIEYPKHTSRDKFFTYNLDSLFQITGTFYVGWIQTTDDLLNIGLDRNNVSNNYMYYSTGSSNFLNSQYPGSWMIRPIVSQESLILNHKDLLSETSIFPNPFSENLYIESTSSEPRTYSLYNLNGKLIYRIKDSSNKIVIPRSNFSKGMYLLEITSPSINIHKKILIN